ncbi:MAG: hypothetical protein RLZZ203_1935 [Cyanobacteriota bacterium]|jgi:hypothetical protein
MANATLRERQAQYKSCPQNVYLIPSQSAVSMICTKIYITAVVNILIIPKSASILPMGVELFIIIIVTNSPSKRIDLTKVILLENKAMIAHYLTQPTKSSYSSFCNCPLHFHESIY